MKHKFLNRYGLNIAAIVENPGADKFAIVEHGLGGYKEQKHLRSIIQAFLDNNYCVLSFDTTNSFGESGGNYENATVTQSIKDLEDVIEWASSQSFFRKPFVLVGHSLGGISTATYAQNHPSNVAALAPIATVVSGQLSFETAKTYSGEENLDHWRSTGVRRTLSRDGKTKKNLKWSHMEDRLKYDLLKHADTLTMPVLLVVGSEDDRTPPEQQHLLFQALPEPKQYHVIQGAEHSFYKQNERNELQSIFDSWIKTF